MSKKKSRRKNISMTVSIGIAIAVFILTLVGYFVVINLSPKFMLFSDDNTETYSGKVSAVYAERRSTGYKNRRYTMVYIQLENGQTFHISESILEDSINYKEFKETILNETVEIKFAKSSSEKLVSIKHKGHSLLTYNDRNKTQQSNRIGFALVCIIEYVFFTLILFLKYTRFYPRHR